MTLTKDVSRDVGQLLWVGFHGTRPSVELSRQIAAGEVGVVVLFRRNLATVQVEGETRFDLGAIAALNDELHRAAPEDAPILIAVDQEGGRVQRVRAPAVHFPPMLGFEAIADLEKAVALARDVGQAMGTELAALGFDIDFAPILDVHTNEENPIIGDRAFSRDPARAATLALAYAAGLADADILSCGKHFPGHGDTAVDSHLELPRIDAPVERLETVELLPFARARAAHLPMLMTAHVVFAALDDTRPATLSKAVITGLLRERMGYHGVVVSDDLDMKAVADHFGIGEAAIMAIEAGCDALLLCENLDHQREARAALIAACERSAEFRERVAEAATRVRIIKTGLPMATRPGLTAVGSPAHRALAATLAG